MFWQLQTVYQGKAPPKETPGGPLTRDRARYYASLYCPDLDEDPPTPEQVEERATKLQAQYGAAE